MPARVNPLTDEHCDCLIRAEQQAVETLALIESCEKCGLKYGAQREELQALRDIARKLRAEFFPTRQ
jgi:hypothetical protein